MGVWSATPETKQYFLFIAHAPIPGIQIHFFWPMVCSGMGATPEPKQCFSALCSSNTTILGTQKHLCWCMGHSGTGVWGATQNLNNVFWHCAVQTPPSQVSKNNFAGVWGTVAWVFGPPPQKQDNFFGIVQLKQPHPRYPKAPLLAYGAQWYGSLERHPRTQTIFFCIVQFKQPHPRYPKTTLLAYRAQWYGCLERHLRNQTIFFCIVQFKHYHPRFPRTPLLAYGVQWYGCLERNPRTYTLFFGIVHRKHLHPRYPTTTFLAYGVHWYGRNPRTQTIFLGGHWGSFGPGPRLWQGCSSVSAPQKKTSERMLFFFS